MKRHYLIIIGVVCNIISNNAIAEQWLDTKNWSIGLDLRALKKDTKNISIHYENKLKNRHIAQITQTENGTLKNDSTFDGWSLSYRYKDYFKGTSEGRDEDWKHQGFFITGFGYGSYDRFKKDKESPGEIIAIKDIDALFLVWGFGVEFKNKKFDNITYEFSFGTGLGGVVNNEKVTASIIYTFD